MWDKAQARSQAIFQAKAKTQPRDQVQTKAQDTAQATAQATDQTKTQAKNSSYIPKLYLRVKFYQYQTNLFSFQSYNLQQPRLVYLKWFPKQTSEVKRIPYRARYNSKNQKMIAEDMFLFKA